MLFILCFSTAIYGIRLVNELPACCHFFVTQSDMELPVEPPSMHRSVLQEGQPKWLFFYECKTRTFLLLAFAIKMKFRDG